MNNNHFHIISNEATKFLIGFLNLKSRMLSQLSNKTESLRGTFSLNILFIISIFNLSTAYTYRHRNWIPLIESIKNEEEKAL